MAAKPAILAVDDDAPVLRAVERDLRSRYGTDYRVLAAGSGADALELVRELTRRGDPIALFVVDQRMPVMTGTEFLTQALELQPEAKRVLLTAYADTDVAIRAINEIRLDQYLLKPWDPPEELLYPVLDDLLADWSAAFRPPFEGLRLLSGRWAPRGHAIRDFLTRNQVPYAWLDPAADEAGRHLAASLERSHAAGGRLRRRTRAGRSGESRAGRCPGAVDPCRPALLRPGHRGGRTGRVGGRRLRCQRGPEDAAHRARGARWPGRDHQPH
jgi:thioredoxin reductase (NADPH)